MKRSKKANRYRNLRHVTGFAVIAIVFIGFVTSQGIGTVSAMGWGDVSLICPIGSLETLLASKSAVPRAIISLAVVVVVVLLFGRAFCSWICPVPNVSRIRSAFAKKGTLNGAPEDPADEARAPKELTEEEKSMLKGCMREESRPRRTIDSRHFVLGGALVSTAAFGFPVFCLVCPVGLTFAALLLLVRAFGFGDVSWTLFAVIALVLLETVVFRKWCRSLCPIGAFMSLVGLGNRTFRPKANASTCREASGKTCGICARVCPEGLDPRHPERGAGYNECTRCHACADACPTGAISFPLVSTGKGAGEGDSPVPHSPSRASRPADAG